MSKIALKPGKAQAVLQALAALDGYERMYREGETERVARVPYNLSWDLRMTLGENKDALERAIEAYLKCRNEIITRHAGGKRRVDPSNLAAVEACAEEVLALDEKDIVFECAPIDFDELKGKAEVNPIPPSVLAALWPLRKQKGGPHPVAEAA